MSVSTIVCFQATVNINNKKLQVFKSKENISLQEGYKCIEYDENENVATAKIIPKGKIIASMQKEKKNCSQ